MRSFPEKFMRSCAFSTGAADPVVTRAWPGVAVIIKMVGTMNAKCRNDSLIRDPFLASQPMMT
jgi:hypothetical protein